MVKASVVIPVWNGSLYIGACLDALLAQGYADLEVIAVDNGSSDGSADLIARRYPQVRLIRNLRNLGFAGGCNTGLKAASGEVLILLNQDTEVLPGWLPTLLDTLQDDRVGVAGCKILYPDRKTVQHAGGWIEWPIGLAHHFGQNEQDDGRWDTPRAVEYVTGAAMAMRRSTLGRVGFLDEGYGRGYFEDADFCLRVSAAGLGVRYEPSATLLHRESSSTSDAQQMSLMYQHGRLRLVLKHLAPDRFLSEFVPAEKIYMRPALGGGEHHSLRLTYLEAIPEAAELFRGRDPLGRDVLNDIIGGLITLYHAAWDVNWWLVEESLPVRNTGLDQTPDRLQEFRFTSKLPVLGGFVSRLREVCFSVAGRHAVRYLTQQQNDVNARLAETSRLRFRALTDAVSELVRESEILANEMARVVAMTDDDRPEEKNE